MSTICQNSGTCVEGEGGATTCVCPSGFSGATCEVDQNFCVLTSCQNGGSCVELRGAETACSCLAGFTGEQCEEDINTFCQLDMCRNGGMCVEGRGVETACNCVPGYTGPICETDIDYCLPSTCKNGGTCVDGAGRNTSCLCPQDFTGPMCSTRLEAPTVPCPAEVDVNWMLSYAETQPGVTVTRQCSDILGPGTMSEGKEEFTSFAPQLNLICRCDVEDLSWGWRMGGGGYLCLQAARNPASCNGRMYLCAIMRSVCL